MKNAITASFLSKDFYGDRVVDGLELSIPTGSIYGLVGRNGAGKTTTLRMLLGLLTPTSGTASLLGESSMELSKGTRQRIGFLSEDEFPYDDIAFTDVLRFVSGFFEQWDWSWCEHLIARLGIDASKRLDRMSKGQRRVAELCIAVAHKPDLLVLDDPAVGLDASVRRELLWTLLETVQEQGSTVLFTSHVLQDVERVVDHVGILCRGRLLMAGPIDDLKARVRRLVLPQEEAPDTLEGEIHREQHGRDVVIVTERYSPEIESRFAGSESSPMNLEDIFLAVAGSVVGGGVVGGEEEAN